MPNIVMKKVPDSVVSDSSRRHIGNFTNWRDYTTYQRSFDQLLKQLKADTR